MGRSWVAAMMVAAAAVAAAAATLMADASRLGYEAVKTVHFDGQVLCQDCTKPGTEWIHGKAIKGARVEVTCLDGRRRVVYHASAATEDNGEFDLPVSRYASDDGKAQIMRPAEDCTVRLVSSPADDCSIMTRPTTEAASAGRSPTSPRRGVPAWLGIPWGLSSSRLRCAQKR